MFRLLTYALLTLVMVVAVLGLWHRCNGGLGVAGAVSYAIVDTVAAGLGLAPESIPVDNGPRRNGIDF